MFVISTRNFPPDIGGMQNLMGGLAVALLKHGPVKVFAEKTNEEDFDKKNGINITRIAGFKIFRKYRKANLIHEFIRKNTVGSSINFISPLKYDLTIKCFMVPYGEDRNLLTFRDISESDQLDKMRRDFIANVSHELKTPLTVIFGYLETLSFSDDGYVDDDIISEMLKQSKRMDSLINDLLKLTKLQSTDIPDKDFSQINLKTIANEIKAACKPEALKNKNNVTILSDNDIFIKGSYEEIYSALINLLSNAIAYSGNNIEIEINYLARNDNEVEFYVKDYGVGIPEESVDRLTERFYRIDKGRSREHGGTGLGLSIVKHIMNRHDGKLEIESGTSKAGNEWKKQSFLIDTGNQYNPEICFQLFGEDKIDMLNHHDEGSKVEVSFNLSSREYNGRYFHNIDAWRIESIEKSEETSEDIPEFNSSADDEDDLPF